MEEKKIIIILILAFLLSYGHARDAFCLSEEGLPSSRLPEHEQITYKIKWLGLPIGTATASINGIKKINGRDAYELVITARTNTFLSRIYPVDDKYVSYLDIEHMYPLRHEVYRWEGRYRKDAVTDFDQVNHKAYFRHLFNGSRKIVDIPPGVHDPVSIAYYFRLVPLKVGDRKDYSVYNNESVYHLFGVIDKKALVNVPRMGKKWAFHLQPYAKLNGEVVKKGKARAYFSCGKDRTLFIGIVEGPVFTKVVAYLAAIK